MSVVGITTAVRTALAASITAGGLECLKYDSWSIASGNIAALGLVRWQLSDNMDQSYGFHGIAAPVYVYQVIDGSLETSLAYQELNVERVIDGLARDRTLGRKVIASDVAEDITQEFYRADSGAAFSVVSFTVVVAPFPNAAS